MTDIPEEISTAAREISSAWISFGHHDEAALHADICAALLSERSRQIERDAKIADGETAQWAKMCDDHPDETEWQCAIDACRDIADLIRGQEP